MSDINIVTPSNSTGKISLSQIEQGEEILNALNNLINDYNELKSNIGIIKDKISMDDLDDELKSTIEDLKNNVPTITDEQISSAIISKNLVTVVQKI